MKSRWISTTLVGVGLLACQHSAVAQFSATGGGEIPALVARIDGADITAADLESKVISQLRALEDAAYQARRRALDSMILERLIEQEAQKRSMSPQELTASIDNGVIVEQAEIERIVAERRTAYLGFSDTQLRQQFHEQLLDQKKAAARQAFVDQLKANAQIELFLRRPSRGGDLPIGPHDPSRGPKDAPITIVEFGDFECPYCKNAEAALEQVLSKWGDTVRFVYVNFPLESHKNAFRAAEASLCAADQGRFWEYHDLLFAAKDLGAAGAFGAIGQSLGLDGRAFDKCLNSHAKKDVVEEQLARGMKSGIDVTPTFLANGQVLRGAAAAAEFDITINQLLQALSPSSAGRED